MKRNEFKEKLQDEMYEIEKKENKKNEIATQNNIFIFRIHGRH